MLRKPPARRPIHAQPHGLTNLKGKRRPFNIYLPNRIRQHMEDTIAQIQEETGVEITMTKLICHTYCDFYKMPREPEESFRKRRKNVMVRKVTGIVTETEIASALIEAQKSKDMTQAETNALEHYLQAIREPEKQAKILASYLGPLIQSAKRKFEI